MTREEVGKKFGITGKSKEIRDLIDIISQIAVSDITVLIYGESGVGKEVFARAIHGLSGRAGKPLINVNCGAIPEGVLESELFGHQRGAFTGAVEARKGYFEIADGGTLFLDEIAEMPISTQVKLLRAIETQEFMRIGAEKVTSVNVRFIGATNKNLQIEVDEKRFREDLYFRLKAVTLNIPPLRKRKGDILELANTFLAGISEENSLSPLRLSSDAQQVLEDYPWPGNIRELKNTIETAAALTRSSLLTAESFLPLLRTERREEPNRNLPVPLGKTSEEFEREFIYRALFEIKKDMIELKEFFRTVREAESAEQEGLEESARYRNRAEEIISIREAEIRAIRTALRHSRGNKRKAAGILEISERTLYRKMNEYNLRDEL